MNALYYTRRYNFPSRVIIFWWKKKAEMISNIAKKRKKVPWNKSSCCTLHEVSRHSIPWEKHETEPRLGNNDDYPQLNDHDPRLCTLLQFPSNNTPSPSSVYWKFLEPSYFYFHLVSISWAKIKFSKNNSNNLVH